MRAAGCVIFSCGLMLMLWTFAVAQEEKPETPTRVVSCAEAEAKLTAELEEERAKNAALEVKNEALEIKSMLAEKNFQRAQQQLKILLPLNAHKLWEPATATVRLSSPNTESTYATDDAPFPGASNFVPSVDAESPTDFGGLFTSPTDFGGLFTSPTDFGLFKGRACWDETDLTDAQGRAPRKQQTCVSANIKHKKDMLVAQGKLDIEFKNLWFNIKIIESFRIQGKCAQVLGSGVVDYRGNFGVSFTACINGDVHLKIWNTADGKLWYDDGPELEERPFSGAHIKNGCFKIVTEGF